VAHLLDRLGVEVAEDTGVELTARCPSPDHADTNPSWAIRHAGDDKHGLHYCFSCHFSGDVFDLVMVLWKCDFPDALEYVRKSCVGAGTVVDDDSPGLFEEHEPPPFRRPAGVRPVAPGSRCARYLEGRAIRWSDIARFGIMDWASRARVYVPLTRGGVAVSCVARSYSGGRPKVWVPPRKGNPGYRWGLFGLDRADRADGRIHLIEGWASCIRVHQAGFQNAIATCGSTVTPEQVQDLAWSREVTTWVEGDAGGRAFAREVRAWLGRGRTMRSGCRAKRTRRI
jgi:DNA primase